MANQKMPIGLFVEQITAACDRKDGYIMGATGQNPRRWKVDSHWFTQYKNKAQHEKALYWRAHAQRVWDCNGLAEGLYRDYTGVSIDTQARYNYQNWCSPKGDGAIPPARRVPGAAVFWGSSASKIHHVAFLEAPVDPEDPQGDWTLIEARGVMTGVVRTRLSARQPDFWGWMTRYFDYPEAGVQPTDRTLQNGMSGSDVRALQTDLIRLGYDLGRWGADGDFGDATEQAVRKFQSEHGLEADGEVGEATRAALEAALSKLDKPTPNPGRVRIFGGNCYVRSAPDTHAKKLGVACDGQVFDYAGHTDENGWLEIRYGGGAGWVSQRYAQLIR